MNAFPKITVVFNRNEYEIIVNDDFTVADLKKELYGLIGLVPERQKIVNLNYGVDKSDNTLKLKEILENAGLHPPEANFVVEEIAGSSCLQVHAQKNPPTLQPPTKLCPKQQTEQIHNEIQQAERKSDIGQEKDEQYERTKQPFFKTEQTEEQLSKVQQSHKQIPEVQQMEEQSGEVPQAKRQKCEAQHLEEQQINGIKLLCLPRQNKKLLILDIDQTIYDTSLIFLDLGHLGVRPFLHDFLKDVYPSYDIGLWSNTQMDTIEKKVEIMNIKNNADYNIMFYADVNASTLLTSQILGRIITKALQKIYDQFPQYNSSNTIICDDQDINFYCNPNNGLLINKYFYAQRHTDTELLKLKTYLNRIAKETDFSAIDHRTWRESFQKGSCEGQQKLDQYDKTQQIDQQLSTVQQPEEELSEAQQSKEQHREARLSEEQLLEPQELEQHGGEPNVTPKGFKLLNPPRQNKKLVILDIDHTIFDDSSLQVNLKHLATRPFLQEFLKEIYPSYDIGLWSNISMPLIEQKVEIMNIKDNADYKITFYADKSASVFINIPSSGRVMTKPLYKIYNQLPLYNSTNTIICDDLEVNFYCNPNNGLLITRYDYDYRRTDTELLKLKTYLSRIANETDFSMIDHRIWKRDLEEQTEGSSSDSP